MPFRICSALLLALLSLPAFAEAPFAFETTFGQLPKSVVPEDYTLRLAPDLASRRFSGEVTIRLRALRVVDSIVLNARGLDVAGATLVSDKEPAMELAPKLDPAKFTLSLALPHRVDPGSYTLNIRYSGPILAECGGLLYLCRDLDGHEMCGVIRARASMSGRLTLGYREAVAATATPWIDAGERVRGHEFHYSRIEPFGAAGHAAWELSARGTTRSEGFVAGGVQASWLHVHWAANPQLAHRFARTAQFAAA